MKKQKFVDIKIEGQGNIGVIDLGEINAQDKNIETVLRQRAEPKMVEALESHFDCEVKVIMVYVKSFFGHIVLTADEIAKDMDEDHQESVTMEETWIY